jgi:prephenate dehydrogenase
VTPALDDPDAEDSMQDTIAIIGLGEVGSIFSRDLRAAAVARIAAFYIAFAAPAEGAGAKRAQGDARHSAADGATRCSGLRGE